jgi:hypothetical protein
MPKYLYKYHEERGRFDAHVSDKDGNTVWEVHYPDYYEDEFTGEMVEGSTIFDDGYMKSVDDVDGLEKYLKGVGVLSPTCELTMDEDEMEEKYAKGGDIETEIKNKLEKATSESENGMALQYEFAVYVPSTEGANQIINKKEFQKRIDEVQLYLSRLFGGYSSSEVDGGYDSTEKGLRQEDIVRVVAFATKKAAKDNFNELINQLGIWAEKWGQEAIGLEFEGDMFYVDKKTKLKRGGFLKKSLRPSVNAFNKRYEMANNGVDSYYKEGGATKRKSGNVPRIEKRVDELNKLIEIANQNDLSIIDTSGTWQTQERYKPLRYVNGILYLNWEELDLYSYLKERGEKWDMKKDKVLKRNMESDGIPTINNLMRLYKKRLKQEGLTF